MLLAIKILHHASEASSELQLCHKRPSMLQLQPKRAASTPQDDNTHDGDNCVVMMGLVVAMMVMILSHGDNNGDDNGDDSSDDNSDNIGCDFDDGG